MRYAIGVLFLAAVVVSAQVAHAQGLVVDVSGVPGTGVTTWTFSGSYTVGNV
jgi:hypothetical protein